MENEKNAESSTDDDINDDLLYLKGIQNYMLGAADGGDKKLHRKLRFEIAQLEKRIQENSNIEERPD